MGVSSLKLTDLVRVNGQRGSGLRSHLSPQHWDNTIHVWTTKPDCPTYPLGIKLRSFSQAKHLTGWAILLLLHSCANYSSENDSVTYIPRPQVVTRPGVQQWPWNQSLSSCSTQDTHSSYSIISDTVFCIVVVVVLLLLKLQVIASLGKCSQTWSGYNWAMMLSRCKEHAMF